MLSGRDSYSGRLAEELALALDRNDLSRFETLLEENPSADLLAPLLQPSVAKRLFPRAGASNVESWLLGITAWTDAFHKAPHTHAPDVACLALDNIWYRFSTNITRGLERARDRGGIGETGGVLAFVDGLSKCVVLRYRFTGSIPVVVPVSVVDAPQSVFSFWDAIDSSDAAARNELKDILATGHKLVNHRNVLVHVDRRAEPLVFGPTIDTLVVSELLAQGFWATGSPSPSARMRVLEVGCGNGMISVGLAQNLAPGITELVAIDIEPQAIQATSKNMVIAGVPLAPRGEGRPQIHLVAGAFSDSVLAGEFDLVICNPPYLPEMKRRARRKKGAEPIGGLELVSDLVGAAAKMLSERGRMLLIVNTLALETIASALPDSCGLDRPFPDGIVVLFELDEVFRDPEWLALLIESGGVRQDGERYCHTVHPIWITRR